MDFHSLMSMRRNVIREECAKKRNYGKINFDDAFYYVSKVDLAWCAVSKADATNWAKRFVEVNVRNESERLKLIGSNGHDVFSALNSTSSSRSKAEKRLIIVRHPFDRLVEAFRDNLERETLKYTELGVKIIAEFRRNATMKFGSEFFSMKHGFGSTIYVREGKRWSRPTFWEFVQWLIKQHDTVDIG